MLYMRVRGHANAWSQMKPSGMDAAGFEPDGGVKDRHERSQKLHPVCPQFIPKEDPTPASKLAFVKRKPGVLLEVQRSSRVSLPAKSAKYAMLRCATKRNAQ